MIRSHSRASMRPVPLLALSDLNARLATLDRYGLKGLSRALVDGLRGLAGRQRPRFAAPAPDGASGRHLTRSISAIAAKGFRALKPLMT
jgi:hypothetical protein